MKTSKNTSPSTKTRLPFPIKDKFKDRLQDTLLILSEFKRIN